MSDLITQTPAWIEDSVLRCLGKNNDSDGPTSENQLGCTVIAQLVGEEENCGVRWLEFSDGSHTIWACPSWDVEQQTTPSAGSVVRISRWKVLTKAECLTRRDRQSGGPSQRDVLSSEDSICLYVHGTIESMGASGLRIVGSPKPIQESIPVRQFLQREDHDWKKIREKLLQHQGGEQAPTTLAKESKAASVSLGSLHESLKNPTFLKTIQAGIVQVRKVFAKKSQDQADSSETNTEEEPQPRRHSAQESEEEYHSPLATQEFLEDPIEDSSDDEEPSMDIGSMLQPSDKAGSANDDPLKDKPIGEVPDDEIDKSVNLATQPQELLNTTSTRADSPSTFFDTHEGDPAQPSERPASSSTGGTRKDLDDGREPIALEDANDKDIQTAFQQAEQASPSVLNRAVVRVDTNQEIPAMLSDDPQRPPDTANEAERGSPLDPFGGKSGKRKRDSERTRNVRGGRIEKILKTVRDQPIASLDSSLSLPPTGWRGDRIRKWIVANSS